MSSLLKLAVVALALSWLLAPDSATVGAAPTPEEIARKAKELGADSFAVREAASKFLWEAGKAAEPALREALKSNDLEVTRRAAEILAKFKWGIYPSTPRNIADQIYRYQAADAGSKQSVIDELFKLGPPGFAAVLKIASAEEPGDVRQGLMLQATSAAAQEAATLTLAGKHAAAEELLELCLTRDLEATRRNYAAFLAVQGRLDAKIDQFTKRAAQPDGRQAAEVLTYLHRARGDLAGAHAAAEQSGNAALLNAILYEQGDWKALAERARTAKVPPEVEPLQALGYRAAYHRLAGQTEKFDQLVAEIRKAGGNKPEADSDIWYGAKALLVNERFADGLALLEKSPNPVPAFELLCAQLRVREAFALADRARGTATREQVFQLELRRARTLYQLGEKDVSLQLFGKLAQEIKASPLIGLRESVIELEYRLGLTELAFAHSSDLLPSDAADSVAVRIFVHLFPDKGETALAWWRFLRKKFSEDTPAATMKRLRSLMAGRTPPREVEALAAELADPTHEQTKEPLGVGLQAAGEACRLAGSADRAQAYFQKAAEIGAVAAGWIRLGDYLAERKHWKEAAAAYQTAWKMDRQQPIALYLQGRVLEQAGEAVEGRKLMDVAHALPLGDDRTRHEFAAALSKRGLTKAAQRERQLIVRTGDFESWYLDDALRYRAAEAVQHKHYLQAATAYERYMLRCLHVNRSYTDNAAYLIVAHMIHRNRARGLAAAGRLDEAWQEVQRGLAALPGDVELPILLVAELEKHGRKKEAAELFTRVWTTLDKLGTDYPNSSWGHNSLAWLAAGCRRQLDQGLEHARKAVQLSPRSAGVLDTLAEVHFQRGEKAEALAAMKKCIELEPRIRYYRDQFQRIEAGDPTADLPTIEDEG